VEVECRRRKVWKLADEDEPPTGDEESLFSNSEFPGP
jgi:hypothetical protein